MRSRQRAKLYFRARRAMPMPMHARGGPSIPPLLSLPLCLGEAQNDGQWVQLHGAEAERFRRWLPPCCGAQAEHQLPSPAGCRSGGMQELGARGCSCKRILNRTHEWRPRGCRLAEWNATRFCEIVGRRVVAEPLGRVDPSPILAFPDEIGLVPLVPVEIGEAGAPYFLVVLARAFDS